MEELLETLIGCAKSKGQNGAAEDAQRAIGESDLCMEGWIKYLVLVCGQEGRDIFFIYWPSGN
jgi:hypothetical protein